MFVKIGTNNRIPAMPSTIQHVTKLVSTLKGGTSLKSYPYLFKILLYLFQ
jgi:hypothetical protein